jgi:hypothetical protein
MGRLIYNSAFTVEFEDRLLAHLQLVIGMKLRRGESFMFGWKDDREVGDGRTAVWMDRTIPMVFRYSGGRPPSINRAWVDVLTQTAGSAGGLQISQEPADPAGKS